MHTAVYDQKHEETRSVFQHVTSNLLAPLSYMTHGIDTGAWIGAIPGIILHRTAENQTSPFKRDLREMTAAAVGVIGGAVGAMVGPVVGLAVGTAVGIEGLAKNAYCLQKGVPLQRPSLEQKILGGEVPDREAAFWDLNDKIANYGLG